MYNDDEDYLEKELLKAVKKGNLNRIRDLIEEGANPNYVCGRDGWDDDVTILDIAKERGRRRDIHFYDPAYDPVVEILEPAVYDVPVYNASDDSSNETKQPFNSSLKLVLKEDNHRQKEIANKKVTAAMPVPVVSNSVTSNFEVKKSSDLMKSMNDIEEPVGPDLSEIGKADPDNIINVQPPSSSLLSPKFEKFDRTIQESNGR